MREVNLLTLEPQQPCAANRQKERISKTNLMLEPQQLCVANSEKEHISTKNNSDALLPSIYIPDAQALGALEHSVTFARFTQKSDRASPSKIQPT